MAYDFDPLAHIAAASAGTPLPKPVAAPQIPMSSANDGGDDMTPDHTIDIGYDGRISDFSKWPSHPVWNAARAASELVGSLIATPMANNPAMAYLAAGLSALGAGMARPNTLREASQGGRTYPTHMAAEEPLAFSLESGPSTYPRFQPLAPSGNNGVPGQGIFDGNSYFRTELPHGKPEWAISARPGAKATGSSELFPYSQVAHRNMMSGGAYGKMPNPLEGGPYMSAPSMRTLQADLQHAMRTAGVPAQETMAAGDTVTYFPHGTYDGVMNATGEMSVGDVQRLNYVSQYGTPGYTKPLTPTEFNAARDSLDAIRDGARVDARGRGLATAPEGVPIHERVANERARLDALYPDDPVARTNAYMDFLNKLYGY